MTDMSNSIRRTEEKNRLQYLYEIRSLSQYTYTFSSLFSRPVSNKSQSLRTHFLKFSHLICMTENNQVSYFAEMKS